MKKLMGLSLLALGLLMASHSEASSVRGAKQVSNVAYTTTVSTISLTPAVLYSVIMSTGAASEYFGVFDSSQAVNVAAACVTSTCGFKARVFYAATSTNTVIQFDPPLQMNTGLMIAPSAATGLVSVVYEKGRITQGY